MGWKRVGLGSGSSEERGRDPEMGEEGHGARRGQVGREDPATGPAASSTPLLCALHPFSSLKWGRGDGEGAVRP